MNTLKLMKNTIKKFKEWFDIDHYLQISNNRYTKDISRILIYSGKYFKLFNPLQLFRSNAYGVKKQ